MDLGIDVGGLIYEILHKVVIDKDRSKMGNPTLGPPSHFQMQGRSIELYELHKYDTKDGIKWMKEFPNPHQPYLANDLCGLALRLLSYNARVK